MFSELFIRTFIDQENVLMPLQTYIYFYIHCCAWLCYFSAALFNEFCICVSDLKYFFLIQKYILFLQSWAWKFQGLWVTSHNIFMHAFCMILYLFFFVDMSSCLYFDFTFKCACCYLSICMRIKIYVQIQIWCHACIHTCIHTYVYISIYIYISLSICVFLFISSEKLLFFWILIEKSLLICIVFAYLKKLYKYMCIFLYILIYS